MQHTQPSSQDGGQNVRAPSRKETRCSRHLADMPSPTSHCRHGPDHNAAPRRTVLCHENTVSLPPRSAVRRDGPLDIASLADVGYIRLLRRTNCCRIHAQGVDTCAAVREFRHVAVPRNVLHFILPVSIATSVPLHIVSSRRGVASCRYLDGIASSCRTGEPPHALPGILRSPGRRYVFRFVVDGFDRCVNRCRTLVNMV